MEKMMDFMTKMLLNTRQPRNNRYYNNYNNGGWYRGNGRGRGFYNRGGFRNWNGNGYRGGYNRRGGRYNGNRGGYNDSSWYGYPKGLEAPHMWNNNNNKQQNNNNNQDFH